MHVLALITACTPGVARVNACAYRSGVHHCTSTASRFQVGIGAESPQRADHRATAAHRLPLRSADTHKSRDVDGKLPTCNFARRTSTLATLLAFESRSASLWQRNMCCNPRMLLISLFQYDLAFSEPPQVLRWGSDGPTSCPSTKFHVVQGGRPGPVSRSFQHRSLGLNCPIQGRLPNSLACRCLL